MKMQIQPDRASCLLYAAAMCADIPAEELREAIGHDGKEILFPDRVIPFCYRGYHIQEIILALFARGHYLINIQRELWIGHDGESAVFLQTCDMGKIILHSKRNAVLIGAWHAVAWDYTTEKIYNPNGEIYPWRGEIFDQAFIDCNPSTIQSHK